MLKHRLCNIESAYKKSLNIVRLMLCRYTRDVETLLDVDQVYVKHRNIASVMLIRHTRNVEILLW